MKTKLEIIRTAARSSMSYKEIAVRYHIKVRVINDLMYKMKKKPSYFVKETLKTLKRNKE